MGHFETQPHRSSLGTGRAAGVFLSLLAPAEPQAPTLQRLRREGLPAIAETARAAYDGFVETGGDAPAAGAEAFSITSRILSAALRAMVVAAFADDQLDAGDARLVLDGLRQLGLPAAELELAGALLLGPVRMEDINQELANLPEACIAYLSAAAVVSTSCIRQDHFMDRLAESLLIPEGLARALDACIEDD
ncbi:MAG: DUF533 domain-containing protein [Pseudomonadales bacterium]|jgi:uncharacterized membrane protein YebE (DUF533 family)|nr:DUF533 domain-containing protein [Pseudomonadales bacterium]